MTWLPTKKSYFLTFFLSIKIYLKIIYPAKVYPNFILSGENNTTHSVARNDMILYGIPEILPRATKLPRARN